MDWKRFQARVPVGTMVRGNDWSGIVLENYPYLEEEQVLPHVAAEYVGEFWEKFNTQPCLRFQPFDLPGESKFLVLWSTIQFFINDQWLTFEQVMA